MSPLTKYRRLRVLPVAILGMALAACAEPPPLQAPGLSLAPRSADQHPLAQREGGVSLAVRDASTETPRLRSVWGASFDAQGILPVEVIVTNRGRDAVELRPADVFVLRGSETLVPLAFDQVSPLIEEPERFRGLALRPTVVHPGESHQAVLFFDVSDGRTRLERWRNAYPQSVSRVHVALTNVETERRLRFGPFGFYR